MKNLRTFSGQEYMISEEEVETLVKIKNSGEGRAFVRLRNGTYLDTSAIESIGDIPLVPMAHGMYPLSKDGRSYIREGRRVYIEDASHIRWLPDPKYQNYPTTGSQSPQLKSGTNQNHGAMRSLPS